MGGGGGAQRTETVVGRDMEGVGRRRREEDTRLPDTEGRGRTREDELMRSGRIDGSCQSEGLP